MAIEKIKSADRKELRNNALQAARKFNWENEEKQMIAAYRQMLSGVSSTVENSNSP